MALRDYVGKPIICWHTQKENKRTCVYPFYYSPTNGTYIEVQNDDFSVHARAEVVITGSTTGEELMNKVGNLVILTINKEPDETYANYERCTLRTNPTFSKESSDIWLDKFDGRGFYQVLDCDDSLDSLIMERKLIIRNPDDLFTKFILVRVSEYIIGPFEYEYDEQSEETSIVLYSLRDYMYYASKYNAYAINDNILVIEKKNYRGISDGELTFIPANTIKSTFQDHEKIDWITKESLIATFADHLKNATEGYTKNDIRKIKELMQHMTINDDADIFTSERANQLKSIINTVFESDSCIEDIVKYALMDDETADMVAEKVTNEYFDDIVNRLEKTTKIESLVQQKSDELTEIKSDIESQQRIFDELTDKVNALKEERDSTIEEYRQEAEQSLAIQNSTQITPEITSERIKDLEEQIESLTNENTNLRDQRESNEQEYINRINELKDSISDLEEKRRKTNADYQRKLIENHELDKELSKIIKRFSDSIETTTAITNTIITKRILDSLQNETGEEICNDVVLPMVTKDSSEEIVNVILEYLQDKAGRVVEYNDAVNYMICLTQGFITTFAGRPGTGKTSLCTILAKALGLARNDEIGNRYSEISVERGWTSHSDYIGYYNPLTKSVEKNNEEIFNALFVLDKESKNKKSCNAPYIMLLDEANLSPIEHYWAPFLKTCDYDSSVKRRISIGGNNIWTIPKHLKFLATVNFDHTTEELSPRFIDRSWIIMLDPVSPEIDIIDHIPENNTTIIAYESLENAFMPREEDSIDEMVKKKWENIKEIFRSAECDMPISARNIKMVERYCAVACRCMKGETTIDKYAPLDYAITQKILPTINGMGEHYKSLFEKLTNECTQTTMPKTAKTIKKMQENAEQNMGYYQFFISK